MIVAFHFFVLISIMTA